MAADLRAIGEQAKLLNAALPFSAAPVEAARPFKIKAKGEEYSRALSCLTQAVYYEAGFEPLEGRRAVAQVVLNRLRHPAFPKSVCGVVYQGAGSPVCQFTFVCDGSLYRAPEAGAWRQAAAIAHAALTGYVEKSVGEATHYHADYVAPRWAPMLSKIAQLGAHIFYRWPGAWGLRASFTGRYIGEPQDPAALRPPPPAPTTEEPVQPGEPVQELTLEEIASRAPGPLVPAAVKALGAAGDVTGQLALNVPRENAAQDTPATVVQPDRRAGAPPSAAEDVTAGGALAAQ
jgi:Cell Wall Hydrolase